MDLELLGKALNLGIKTSMDDSLNTVGWLNKWSEKPLTIAAVEMALADVFAKQLQVEWVGSEPTAKELHEAELLCAEKFACSEWNLKR